MPEKSKFSGRCRFLEERHVVRIIFDLFRPAAYRFGQIARGGGCEGDEVRAASGIGGQEV